MRVTITVRDKTFTRDLKDLSKAQLSALGEFLGVNAERELAFDDPYLNSLERYVPVKVSDVVAVCPQHNENLRVTFHASDVTEDAPLAAAPRYKARTRAHYGTAHCKLCRTVHQVVRHGLLVSTTVEGLPFSREYK